MDYPKAVLFALAGTTAWLLQAGGLEVRVSNQSLSETITLTQLLERGEKEDVSMTLLTDPDPAPGPVASRVLKPGATARIALLAPPSPGAEPEIRSFRLTREGDPAECYFSYRADNVKGQPAAVLEYDPCPDPRIDLVQVKPDLLVFCGAHRTGN